MTAYSKIKKQLKELYKQQRLRKSAGGELALTDMERELDARAKETLALIAECSLCLSPEEKIIISDHYVHGLSWLEVRIKRVYTHDGLMSLNRRVIRKMAAKKSTH